MSCKKIQKFFLDYYFNELDKEQAEIVSQHLSVCDKCSKYYVQISEVLQTTKNKEYKEPDAFYVSRMIAKIDHTFSNKKEIPRFIPAVIKSFALGMLVFLGMGIGLIISKDAINMKNTEISATYTTEQQKLAEEYGLFSANDNVIENLYQNENN